MFFERKISKLLNVFFLWLLMTHKCSCDEKNQCIYNHEDRIYTAICSDKKLEAVPSNLDRNIEGLYLDDNKLDVIGDSAFENTPNVKYLFINSNTGVHITPNAFGPLKNLHTLDLSKDRVVNVPAIKFPESLKLLNLDGINRIKITTISYLPELKSLSLQDCNLDKVPSFGGPLIHLSKIDLRGSLNKLENFTLDSLANLCSLKELYINSTASIQDSCECLRLNQWIKDNKIFGSNVTCGSIKNDKTCSTSPSSTFTETYNSCVLKRKVTTSISVVSTVCYILGGCFVCAVLLIELYIVCNRKNYSDDTIRAYLCCKRKING
ncbi:lumican-like [Planococcus citri]|uniref:lumican-like n=1 Tax=Planococcus citri TaxID=170843 RepID=UPI0031F92AEA